RLAWPIAGERRIRRLQTVATIGVATIVLAGIEVGQTFLPMRFPDVTDLLIGTIGAMAGIATVTAFACRQQPISVRGRCGESDSVRGCDDLAATQIRHLER